MSENFMKLIPFKVEALQNIVHDELTYGIKDMQAPEIWEKGEEGEKIVIAILDTGIDINHPDLKENIIGGRNFTNEGSYDNYNDLNGHGTHVAGTIAAVGKGVKGVAPKAKILACKVLDGNGSGSYYSIISGIRFATNWRGANGEKVRVINMSLGGSHNDPEMYKAILEASAAGIMIVVASGNEGNNDRENDFEISYPALYNECITVAACNDKRKLANFSNTHLEVDFIAAGVDVLSTYPKSGYARLSGTSMATPHVAGALALCIAVGEKQFQRTLTTQEIYGLIAKCSCGLGYEKSSEGNGFPELKNLFENC